MAQHWALRTTWIVLGGFGFYLLTGNGSVAALGIGIISYLEFRTGRLTKIVK